MRRIGHGPFQSGELRQGLGHYDQDQVEARCGTRRQLTHISVDTDKIGVVWMTGTANSQEEVDKAVAIARDTEGVKSVKNNLNVQKDR